MHNDGVTTVCGVSAWLSAYDAQGLVVGDGRGDVEADYKGCLAPGEVGTLRMSVGEYAGLLDHYAVWFQCISCG